MEVWGSTVNSVSEVLKGGADLSVALNRAPRVWKFIHDKTWSNILNVTESATDFMHGFQIQLDVK